MIESCRPWRRIFYLVVTLGIGAVGVGLAPIGQASTRIVAKKGIAVAVAAAVPQSGPALTSVIDTVYRADGSAAQGVLVITWPAFVSASGTAVAAGVLDVTLGTNGALDVALAPNAGATPAGSYYTVVYQ